MFFVQKETIPSPGQLLIEPIGNSLVPCTQSVNGKRFFPYLSNDDFTSYLANNYTYCIDSSKVVFKNNFQNVYDNIVADFVVKYCDASLLKGGLKCEARSSVDKLIKQHGLYIQLLLPNTYIDSQTFVEPIKTYLDFNSVSINLASSFTSYLIDVQQADLSMLDNPFLVN